MPRSRHGSPTSGFSFLFVMTAALATASGCVSDSSASGSASTATSVSQPASRVSLETLNGEFWIETDPDSPRRISWVPGTDLSVYVKDCEQPNLSLDQWGTAGSGDRTYWSFPDPERVDTPSGPEGIEVLLHLPFEMSSGSYRLRAACVRPSDVPSENPEFGVQVQEAASRLDDEAAGRFPDWMCLWVEEELMCEDIVGS